MGVATPTLRCSNINLAPNVRNMAFTILTSGKRSPDPPEFKSKGFNFCLKLM